MAVSDLQRLAAKALGGQYATKEWVDMLPEIMTNCPFCTVAVPPHAIKCPNCKEILKPEEYAAMTKANEKPFGG